MVFQLFEDQPSEFQLFDVQPEESQPATFQLFEFQVEEFQVEEFQLFEFQLEAIVPAPRHVLRGAQTSAGTP